jgi:acetoin utilization protein AcuB
MRTAASRLEGTIRAVMVREPRAIAFDRTLADAHRLMRENGIRHLPVMRDSRLVGILSLRDLHLVQTLRQIDPEKVRVEDAMTPNPFSVSPDAALADVARAMARNKWGSVVVMEGDRLVGMFTTIDALRLLADLVEAPRPGSR